MPTVYKLPGGAIQANTITTSQLQTTVVTQIQAGGGPKVKSLIYPSNDTAANTTGGQTVYLTGSGFAANAQVLVNGAAVPSQSFISASNISFTTPALSTGTYPVYLINPEDGGTAILYPGLLISGEPTWVTSAGSLSGSQDEGSAWSFSLSTTGDTPITYALAAGNTLPSGITLAANGLISGTISSPTGNVTTYTFSVVATDAQNQDSTRQFSVTTSTGEGVLFANNVLLIHADGTNNQNNHTFLDSSNNNFTITRNGNATQGSFSPFSQTGWSVYFDGSGDYLSIPYSTAFSLPADFTIEFWVNYSAHGSYGGLVCNGASSGNPWSGWQIIFDSTSDNVRFEGETSVAFNSNTALPKNVWNHVAVVRNGSTITMYFNGVSVGSTTSSITFNSGSASLVIGVERTLALYTTGYISNVRVVKGTALYTSNFTPSTTPLTAVSNTQLLTCQSNRFRDASNNNFTVTRNGDTSIQPFSPFAPTTSYSTSSVGGSLFLDGTGDYLSYSSPSTSVRDWATTDFTLECWVYATSWSGWGSNDGGAIGPGTFAHNVYNSTTYYWGFGPYIDGKLYFSYWNGSNRNTISSTPTIPLGQWNHIAMTKTSSGVTLFLNGVAASSTTALVGTPESSGTTNINIGVSNSNYVNGYISGLRVVKGTAVYTGSYTVPTAPPTNVANTSMLLNFTNAGIYDQTAKNIIETVGDAKVSTTQYKYGTASMYFDGTGDALKVISSGYPTLANFTKSGYAGTIEMWVYVSSMPADRSHLVGFWASSVGWTIDFNASGDLFFSDGGSGSFVTLSSKITSGSWIHLAFVNTGSIINIYRNGTNVGTKSNYSPGTPTTNLYVGIRSDSTLGLIGYIDDLRITQGYARYTSNFTPPSSAFKDK